MLLSPTHNIKPFQEFQRFKGHAFNFRNTEQTLLIAAFPHFQKIHNNSYGLALKN